MQDVVDRAHECLDRHGLVPLPQDDGQHPVATEPLVQIRHPLGLPGPALLGPAWARDTHQAADELRDRHRAILAGAGHDPRRLQQGEVGRHGPGAVTTQYGHRLPIRGREQPVDRFRALSPRKDSDFQVWIVGAAVGESSGHRGSSWLSRSKILHAIARRKTFIARRERIF